ncbi:YdeI/OmpD-associated family protein [Rhodobacter sp. NSM]|uniref:YdeI/OmpD-associated family protein n=1 Tax=Rhodobacter sp. NSM TaxID=3457501 RepID=UPI003FD36127
MPDSHAKVQAFFDGLVSWRGELLALRGLLLASPLVEDFKWSSPVYTFEGCNVAIVWGFKDRATLGFFKGVLLRDPDGVLEPPGDNSRSSRVVNFTEVAQIERLRPTLRALINEAIRVERAGLKVDFPKDDLDMPRELEERLSADAAFRAAFDGLTPGRRRGWILHFGQAKRSTTRAARIEKAVPRILEGKGMNDR